MSKPVILDPEALLEMEEAGVFYDAQEPGLGLELLAETSRAVSQIQNQPSAWALMLGVAGP